ncbi:MAG: hypothetical protein MZV63_15590 [Marinilabiliales bacterium]|nr:hypothetical protein [Marinilabiliales bacterium]
MAGDGTWGTPTAAVFITVADAASPRVSITNNAQVKTSEENYVKLKEMKVNVNNAGGFTLSWAYYSEHDLTTVYTRAYKNGVAFGSTHSIATIDGEIVHEAVSGPIVARRLVSDLRVYGELNV